METQTKPETGRSAAVPAPPKPPKFKVPGKKAGKWIKRILILAVLAAVVVLMMQRCQNAGTQIAAGAYLTETAAVRDMTVSVSGTGPIEPIHSYRATTLVSGEVLEAPFEEGQTIAKGDLLFRIDAKDVETNIQQLELSLRTAQLNLDDLLKRQNESTQDLDIRSKASGVITTLYVEQGDTIAAGMVLADVLDRDHMKLTVPFHSADAAGFVAGQAASVIVDGTLETLPAVIDELAVSDEVGPGGTLVRQVTFRVENPGALAETTRGTASVNGVSCASGNTFTYATSKQITAKASGELEVLSIAEGDRVSDGQIIGRLEEVDMDSQIENARIQLDNAQLSLQNARDRLEDYEITSTISGTVIEKNVEVGDNVGGNSAATAGYTYMAVIYDLSALTFDVRIDELDINKIQVGQKVEITADALDGERFTGTVDKVNINGTTAGGVTTYPVTVLVDGTPEALKPGMNISAEILVEHVGEVLTIPVDAVSRGNEVLVAGPGCLDETGAVVDLTAIETRQVTLGRNDEEYIEILDGLEAGEIILMENQASNALAMMMAMGG